MLAALLRGSDWSKIADYLSPVLFQVVPPLTMAQQIRILVANYRDKAKFSNIKLGLDNSLGALPWQMRLAPEFDQINKEKVEGLGFGERLLRVYFWQILTQPTAILDFRSKSWKSVDYGAGIWCPSPLYIEWDHQFITAIRKLYVGFYHGDDKILDESLDAIGLTPGKAALLRHFGPDQDAVAFDLAHFRSSFHDVFVACKHAKSRLHTNVLGLGAVLACLYEHLQLIGGTYDVRSAFFEAESFAKGQVGKFS